MLARHAGASRFAHNQCLQLVLDALEAKRVGTQVSVPWSRFDLINRFNAWKNSQAAGRIFAAPSDGSVTEQVIGLAWRPAVSAQVFEEAAVDLSRALAAYRDGKTSTRKSRQVGFPKRKRKGRCRDSFRLRNKRSKDGSLAIRVGKGHPRLCGPPEDRHDPRA
jgi:putative transposase